MPLVFQRLTVRDEELNRAESDDDAHDGTGSCPPTAPQVTPTGHAMSGSQLRRNLVDGIGFDHIAGLDIAEILHPDAALVALLDLPNVVFETA